MKQTTIRNFYDELFAFFQNNCKKVSCLEHLDGTSVLVIAVGTKEQIASLISYLNQGEKKPFHIYMVVQKNIMPMMRDLGNKQCRFVEWEGPYTSEVIRYVADKTDLNSVSHLFYQGRQPLDFRDMNLYDILLEIKKTYKSDLEAGIYMQDIREQVYWYRMPEKIRKGMDVYQAVDAYLEVQDESDD